MFFNLNSRNRHIAAAAETLYPDIRADAQYAHPVASARVRLFHGKNISYRKLWGIHTFFHTPLPKFSPYGDIIPQNCYGIKNFYKKFIT